MPAESGKPSVKLSLPLVSIDFFLSAEYGPNFGLCARNTSKISSMSSAQKMSSLFSPVALAYCESLRISSTPTMLRATI